MSKYKSYSQLQVEELLSNFLINSWSYSKATSFARNEKAFERSYIYQEKSRRSASPVAGNAYHESLQLYFQNLSVGNEISIIDMERVAFAYIDNIPANDWRLQKTTPTVDECIMKATKDVTALINHFNKESSIYTAEMAEILGIELRCEEWLTINGVDIPLPCHAVIDLVIRLKDGRVVVIDHKSKSTYTDEAEMYFTGSKQAITYVKCLESKIGCKVDEFWFIENKIAQNKDGSPQLKLFKLELNDNNRRIYEVILYEPLRRMIEAVSDPDYVYIINDNDNFTDTAELYEFWVKTMISEVDDFNIADNKRELIAKRQKKIRDSTITALHPKVITAFRENAASFITYDLTNKNMTQGEKIEHVLRTFSIVVKVAHEIDGYSSNTFLLEVSAGIKISNVTKYTLDIANALDVSSIRIGKNLMVYDGKSYLFIEVSKKRNKDLLFDAKYLAGEKIPIGVDNFGRTVIWDLNSHATPHVLVCGATGSGKSVSIIATVEYAKLAGVKDIIIFDPKYEFCNFAGKGVQVFNDILDIENQMAILVVQMQKRAKTKSHRKTLIVFDEFADAVSSSRSGAALDIKENVKVGYYAPKGGFPPEPKYAIKTVGRHNSLEENLKMLLQKGRSLGYRIIAATQRASVKVITGDAKVNFPVQICFRVPKEIDSKVVIDEAGAETLAGMGDGLIKSPEYQDVVRFQGFYKP